MILHLLLHVSFKFEVIFRPLAVNFRSLEIMLVMKMKGVYLTIVTKMYR